MSKSNTLAQRHSNPVPEKSREFICGTCNARCTRGTDGDEYGHQYGCPERPERFPSGGSGKAYYKGDRDE
ncbi:hypothetical protein [Halopiger thermotolerans]